MGMPKNTLRSSLITALAVGMLPLLAACGGGSGDEDGKNSGSSAAGGGTKNVDGDVQLNIPEGVNAEPRRKYVRENAIAACMKKEGFTYTPHVTEAPPADVNPGDGEDYAAAKKYRQKYGFGNYAPAVYPDDPKAPFYNAGRSAGKPGLPRDDDIRA